MGRKKRNSANMAGPPQQHQHQHLHQQQQHQQPVPPQQPQKKKQKGEEKYLVKKYRADKHYDAMDAFVKYTKAHRMLDAAYVRTFKGTNPEKPFVFSIRVANQDLAWGRGNSREKAMDCACRAAFALVAAHGYNNFPVDEDCLTQEPQDLVLLPPPPPPPLPPGYPPGFVPPPPPPGGLAPPYPPPPPPPTSLVPPPPMAPQIIPQPTALTDTIPVASSLGNMLPTPMSKSPSAVVVTDTKQPLSMSLLSAPPPPPKKTLKGGLVLVFDSGEDGPNELCMEERRASLPRYQKLLQKALQAAM